MKRVHEHAENVRSWLPPFDHMRWEEEEEVVDDIGRLVRGVERHDREK